MKQRSNIQRPRRRGFLAAMGAASLLCGLLGIAAAQKPAPMKPGVPRQGEIHYTDPRLGPMPPVRSWDLFTVLPSRPVRTYGPVKDPKSGQPYPYRLVVRIRSDAKSASTIRYTVHTQKSSDDLLARRVGRAMVYFYWLGRDYVNLGEDPHDQANTRYDIWLTHDGKPGAEQIKTNLYLYAVDEARAPAEWLRELAHEYSHHIFPRLGPFDEPEMWANGYYGERLLLKWLFDNGFTKLWDKEIDGQAYIRNQVVTLRDRFLNGGPASPDSVKTDANGMEHYIGFLLALEQMHSPKFFQTLIYRLSRSSPRPGGLTLTYSGVLRDQKPPEFTINPLAFIPSRSKTAKVAGGLSFSRAEYWVYLPGGRWQLALPGTTPPDTEVNYGPIKLERRPGLTAGRVVYEANISALRTPIQWRRLSIAAPAGASVHLDALRFVQVRRR